MEKMSASRRVPSLGHKQAAKWNQTLMKEFQNELERNPTADLMTMFHEPYLIDHRRVVKRGLSSAAKYNLDVMEELALDVKLDPESAKIIFPLSAQVHDAVAKFMEVPTEDEDGEASSDGGEDYSSDEEEEQSGDEEEEHSSDQSSICSPEGSEASTEASTEPTPAEGSPEPIELPCRENNKALAVALKRLLWDSPKIWEFPGRGVVVQCCEGVVAKVMDGSEEDTTEYTSMEFVAERAPGIPAPRNHGFIILGRYSVLFMTHIPGTTLEKVWPSLYHEDKLSIQRQLEKIFLELRALSSDQQKVGGVCGEGAKEDKLNPFGLFPDLTTPKQFSDLQFQGPAKCNKAFIDLLQSFLEKDHSVKKGLVFSHGDLRPANIMVKKESGADHYEITGLIDWEESGFYPTYYESVHLTRNFTGGSGEQDDWYSYVPKMISPRKFPVRWLVDRMWDRIYNKW
ncbi:hypothetical protein N7509_007708 [Penicillium cosmopolitanum]|uniref:Aminoglycoside phosphotransferase domain-containing protein n=1 Tax=Penicillium cosmopolitanum TaxID=1131564 RepID=A0A9W9VZF1_9EURO|nr:uncharacterized protein N7509_007708 [Penicillium cosmopolitanum]KAJ5392218.1 hypothetical protein N7509_007708 [Penicillium cosmopolitanum]